MIYKKLLLAGVLSLALILGLGGITNADMTYRCGEAYTDFLNTQGSACPPWTGIARTSGTVSIPAAEAGHPGIIQFISTTVANTGYIYMLGSSATVVMQNILLAGGERTEFVFRTVNISANLSVRMGFQDRCTETLPTDGAYLNISGTSLNGTTVTNGIFNSTAVNYSISANTWYRGIITISAGAAQANFYLYDMSYTLLWSGTLGNVPNVAGRATGHGVVALMTAAESPAAGLLDMDFMYLYVPCMATPSPSPTVSPSPSPTASLFPTVSPTPSPSPTSVVPPDACCYKYSLDIKALQGVCSTSTIGLNWTQNHSVWFYGVEALVEMYEVTLPAGDLIANLSYFDPIGCSIGSTISTVTYNNTSFANGVLATFYFDFPDICLEPDEYIISFSSPDSDCEGSWWEFAWGDDSRNDIGMHYIDTCYPNLSLWFKIWEYCWEGCPVLPTPTTTASPSPSPITTGTPCNITSWVTFTSDNSSWWNSSLAHDGNYLTGAEDPYWTLFPLELYLNGSSVYFDKIRWLQGGDVTDLVYTVDIFYNSSWHEIYNQSTPISYMGDWWGYVNISPSQQITGARYKILSGLIFGNLSLYEIELGEPLPCPGCPFNLVITSLGGDEVYLSWQSTPYVTNYMVRMRTDFYPANEIGRASCRERV